LHPNTAHNIIRTLFRRGYLLQQDDNRYALGPRCYQIGMRCNPWEQLRQVANPLMRCLSQETLDNAFLGVRSGDKLLCVTRTEGRGVIVVAEQQDWLDQMHSTATGKVILAYEKGRWVDTFLATQHLQQRTPHTLVDRQALIDQLAAIRMQGYAICQDESAEGVSAVGVPVFGMNGELLAALGQSFPTFYLITQKIDLSARIDILQRYARQISEAYATPIDETA
ncbi:MAG TPA: IclR family transcriptional regulator, partial [Armatimonadota bacterium]|nr:IclR family transcriptional regulator [Armatimonadota bacterium]